MFLAKTDWAQVVLTAWQVDVWPESQLTLPSPGWWQGAHRVALRLPSKDRAVPVCRGLADIWLDARHIHDADTRHLVLLVLSELATNALGHSDGDHIVCQLWRANGFVFVKVRDQGGTRSVPQVCSVRPEQEHGRGLALVADLVGRWGFRMETGRGCTVWAGVPVPLGTPE